MIELTTTRKSIGEVLAELADWTIVTIEKIRGQIYRLVLRCDR